VQCIEGVEPARQRLGLAFGQPQLLHEARQLVHVADVLLVQRLELNLQLFERAERLLERVEATGRLRLRLLERVRDALRLRLVSGDLAVELSHLRQQFAHPALQELAVAEPADAAADAGDQLAAVARQREAADFLAARVGLEHQPLAIEQPQLPPAEHLAARDQRRQLTRGGRGGGLDEFFLLNMPEQLAVDLKAVDAAVGCDQQRAAAPREAQAA